MSLDWGPHFENHCKQRAGVRERPWKTDPLGRPWSTSADRHCLYGSGQASFSGPPGLALSGSEGKKGFCKQRHHLRPPVVPQSFLGAPPPPKGGNPIPPKAAEGCMGVSKGQDELPGGIYEKTEWQSPFFFFCLFVLNPNFIVFFKHSLESL